MQPSAATITTPAKALAYPMTPRRLPIPKTPNLCPTQVKPFPTPIEKIYTLTSSKPKRF